MAKIKDLTCLSDILRPDSMARSRRWDPEQRSISPAPPVGLAAAASARLLALRW